MSAESVGHCFIPASGCPGLYDGSPCLCGCYRCEKAKLLGQVAALRELNSDLRKWLLETANLNGHWCSGTTGHTAGCMDKMRLAGN